MIKLILLFSVAISIASIQSCSKQDSSDVNQTKIWTHYELSYNTTNDVTDVIARFRFGGATGTILELSDSTGAKVSFNGQIMPYAGLWGAHHLQFAGNITTGTFAYTNTAGTTYSNSVPAGADTVGFQAGFDTIVKSQAETFYWTGTALAANQAVGIYVGTWAWDSDALFYTEADGATSLVMGASAKNGLTPGNSTVYLSRAIQKNDINAPSVGGFIKYSYTTQKQNVKIVP